MNWNDRFSARTHLTRRSAIRELLKVTSRPDMISFAGGLPAPELFPAEPMRTAMDRVLTRGAHRALQYSETEGLPELREWIAARFSSPGTIVSREQVMITHGAQQGLDLAGRILLNEGDLVAVENPTYLALLAAWGTLGARFEGVPVDAGGMQVDRLTAMPGRRPKVVYTVPNFQNPTGTTLTPERRTALVRACREANVGIIEDDPYGDLVYEGDPLPSLFALDQTQAREEGAEGNVIRAGTFSKILAPGLRLGWVIAPACAIERMVLAKQSMDLHTATLNQMVALELALAGVIDAQIPRLRSEYRRRRDVMLGALARFAPPQVTWTQPKGGMFLLVTLPEALDATNLLASAIEREVAYVPGESLHLQGAGRSTLRLNFTNAAPDRIEEGIQRLCGVFASAMESVSRTTISAARRTGGSGAARPAPIPVGTGSQPRNTTMMP